MSMTLHKINRTELIRQLGVYKDHLNANAKVFMMNRQGEKKSIVKVKENNLGVFLYPYFADAPEIKMAKLMGSDMHEHGLSELIDKLSACESSEVWLQWPTWNKDELDRCVGKIGSVSVIGKCDELLLFPVPKDIETVNEEVRQICAKRCKSAEMGLQCGDCELCGICQILKDADEEITKRREV